MAGRFYSGATAFPAPSLVDLPPPATSPRPQVSISGGNANGDRGASAIQKQLASAACSEGIGSSAAPAADGELHEGSGGARWLALAEHAASGRAVGAAPESALEAALVDNAKSLCRPASALQPPGAKLVEV